MKSFKLILLSINLLLVNSQTITVSRDCPSLNNFLNLPQNTECCTLNGYQCDAEGYLTHISINAQNNYIENIPKTIMNSSSLEYLNFNENNIKFLPNDFFTSLTKLKELELGNNIIENIPSTISGLDNLIYLNLRYNNLKSLPENLFNLPSLGFINLDENQELNVLINRSSSNTSIDTCSIKGINVVCYEPGSCNKLLISKNEKITDEEAKTKYISCSEYNRKNGTNSNSNSKSKYLIIGISVALICLVIISALLFIKYKKKNKNNNNTINTININNNNK
ncbi:L domain-like protein [Anaeromyces robustus]|uniref:L domain-like protein n=1 Tax=Anaeromyces robustus TaxID=1754192 RepID=A0A1Y1VEU9_9FUNG|nr:L domain-like protein [Anaeromyces robustus]|eukprot:ORX54636.1 L domain-like protein [Anaeromyces robustus]